MPIYTYIHPETEETIDLAQSIHEKHVYIDEKGIEWKRVFTVPEVNTQGTLKAECSSREFSEYTKDKKGTFGDMFDRSAELSEKRKKIYGKDPVKEKHFNDWSKKRKGKTHPKKYSE
jgi:predicted nucleic acid-binding Zn ribbon protein